MCVCVCLCVRERGRGGSTMKAKKLHWTGDIRATQILTIIPSNIENLQ